MDEKHIQQIREALWRRSLSEAERQNLESWLAAHPDHQTDWELELMLSRAMTLQPEPEISGDFTDRVMAELQRGSPAARAVQVYRASHWALRWLPRLAVVVVLSSALWQYSLWQTERDREIAAKNIQTMTEVTSVASPELLADYETISRLSTITPDTELLSMME